MLTVVVGHVYDQSNWVYGIYEKYLQDFIYIFHMPLFMFISGYLFNLTKISNNTSYKTVIKEKVVRLLIPYFAFNTKRNPQALPVVRQCVLHGQ